MQRLFFLTIEQILFFWSKIGAAKEHLNDTDFENVYKFIVLHKIILSYKEMTFANSNNFCFDMYLFFI